MTHDSTSDEPTQPLTGWQRPEPAEPPEPGAWAPPREASPAPAPPQPPVMGGPYAGPYAGPQPGAYAGPPPGAYAGPPPTLPLPAMHRAPQAHRASGSGMSWLAVVGLSLIVGLLGGLAGAALQSGLDDGPDGTVPAGLEGVRTQTAAPLEADNGSIPAVAQALLPSTVQIVADFEGGSEGATGSGFVLDRDGHVVTNNHVVAGAAGPEGTIVVIDHQGTRHPATVVGRSPVYDLAVLAIKEPAEWEPAALGASQVLRVGDPVVAFGSPLGLSQTVTSGIVSALNRPVTTTGESDDDASYINAVQTDAAINPGNSGGPLVNLAGEVVGVNSAIATTGGGLGGESGNIGVGFAIPIEQVRTTVDQILRSGQAEYPVIGAKVNTGSESSGVGARITEVMDDSPAQAAGLLKDDVVIALGDLPITDGIALIVAIRTHRPGETVEFTIVRDGDERRVELELDGEVG